MPFIVALLSGLVAILPQLIIRCLITFGVGGVVYAGVKTVFDQLESYVQSGFGGLAGTTLQIIAVMNVDRALTLVFSAMAVRLTLAGLNAAGALTKMTWKPPAA